MAEDVLVGILRNALLLEEDYALSDETQLQDIPNLDSLGRVRLVMEIEQIVGDRLSMEEIIGMESIGNIRGLLAAKGRIRTEA